MKYYWLASSLENKIIGKYPQSEECFKYGDIYNVDYENLSETLINVPEPILVNKAKKTSYFVTSAINSNSMLILNKEFIEFLRQFKVGEYKLWDMKVHHKGEVLYDYQLFHLLYPSQEKYVDYGSSEFYIGKLGDYQYIGDDIDVSDYQNYLSTFEILRSQKLWMKTKKIILNFSTATEDLIRITNTPQAVGSKGYYVSERLKNAIEENGFTGMKFKDIEDTDNGKRIKVIY